MKLPWRKTDEPQTPARHHLADQIQRHLAEDPGVVGFRRVNDNPGPLGGIADTFYVDYEHEGRRTNAKIAVYGDSDNERIERFGQ